MSLSYVVFPLFTVCPLAPDGLVFDAGEGCWAIYEMSLCLGLVTCFYKIVEFVCWH